MADTRYDLPGDCQLIEVHVTDLKQLFHSLDPTPFRQRDLDPKAEEFIAGWARELDADKPIGLVVHVDADLPSAEQITTLREAVRDYFGERAAERRRRLRQLFRVGRTRLVIGLIFLAASILLGDLIASMLEHTRFPDIARESLLIGGWVAMWRPLEVFLYDWWPIRSEARFYNRLAAMPVEIQYRDGSAGAAR